MIISSQLISEKLIEDYVKTPLSLQDQALTKLAIQLCTCSYLKNHIYNPETDNRKLYTFNEWDNLLAKQLSTICDRLLPYELQKPLNCRIRAVAISLFQWNREHQIRLGMPSYRVRPFLKPSDWTVEGKINERKVAERIVEIENIPVNKRYELACLNFLEGFIFLLWNQIRPKEREYYTKDCQSELVRLWSNNLAYTGRPVDRFTLYQNGFHAAVENGHRSAVTYCWRAMDERQKKEVLINATLQALSKFNNVRKVKRYTKLIEPTKWTPTQEQFIDIFFFLFSCMSKEQRFQFFNKNFETPANAFNYDTKFVCFLEYPYEGNFMPIISKLWGILPEPCYGRMVKTIAERHFNNMDKEEYQNRMYWNLLLELLDKAPENYKSYVFSDKSLACVRGDKNIGKELMFMILRMQPFESGNIEMIRNILKNVPQQEKQLFLLSEWTENLVTYFIKYKNLESLDSILKDCLTEEEKIVFRKKFVLSLRGKKICFHSLAEGNVDFVHSLLNWGHFSEEDVSKFKPELINLLYFTHDLRELLENVKFDSFHRVLDWCFTSNDARNQFKETFLQDYAMYICLKFLECSQWRYLMKFLSWAYPSDKALDVFKLELFKNHWGWIVRKLSLKSHEEVDFLIEWCGLSKEIIQVKDAMFPTNVVNEDDDDDDEEEKINLILTMCNQLRDNFLYQLASDRLHERENDEVSFRESS